MTYTGDPSAIEKHAAAARESALAIAAPDLTTLVVTGSDRLTWLNGLVTCDLSKKQAGDAAYGLAVSQKGRILADVIVVVAEESVTLVVPAAHVEELRVSCERYLIMEDAEIVSGGGAVTLIHGPRSREVLDAARAAGALGAPLDRTGLGGAVVVAPADGDAAIGAAIDGAVAEVGGARGDATSWEAVRIERAVPQFGRDFGAANYPQEVGLEKTAVSFSKGCYLGQEVICMLEMRGHVKKKLVQLRVEGQARAGAEVADASGKAIGEVTSVSPGAQSGGVVALAMVKRAHAEVGGELRVAGAPGRVLAIV